MLLSLLMFSNAVLLAQFFSSRLNIIEHGRFEIYYYFTRPTYFLLMPLLFMFVKSLCLKNFKFRKAQVFHAVWYTVAVIYLAKVPEYFEWKVWIYRLFLYLEVIGYFISTQLFIKKYHHSLKNEFSNLQNINLSWLQILITGYFLICLGNLLTNLLDLLAINWYAVSDHIFFSIVALNFAIAAIIVYRGLKHSVTYSGIIGTPKYAGSKISRADFEDYKYRLITFMETNHPYLDSLLSMETLSKKISLPAKYISQVINESFKMNFYDFINSYRIDAFKRLLVDPANREKTILELLYEVGYNSKTTFNMAFKKHTGMTPSQFKKAIRTQ